MKTKELKSKLSRIHSKLYILTQTVQDLVSEIDKKEVEETDE